MEDQPGGQLAAQLVLQGLPTLEQLRQGLEVLPEVGAHGDLEGAPGLAADAAPQAGLVLGQEQVAQAHRIGQMADEQAAFVGVVDPQVQDELLLMQTHLHRLHLEQVQLWLTPGVAAPAGAARQPAQQQAECEQAGQGAHVQLPR